MTWGVIGSSSSGEGGGIEVRRLAPLTCDSGLWRERCEVGSEVQCGVDGLGGGVPKRCVS